MLWELYYSRLQELQEEGKIGLPYVPKECQHNAHMFYIKTADLEERTELIAYLGQNGIKSVFHYVPLHTSIAGRKSVIHKYLFLIRVQIFFIKIFYTFL